MLVERRRSALPFDFLVRITFAWGLAAGLLIAVHWLALARVPNLDLPSAGSIILPLGLLGFAMVLAARIAWRLIGDEESTLAALILVLAVPVLLEFAPLRADHHGWGVICALAAVNALMLRRPGLGGFLVGAICAVWLTISLEGLAVTLAMIGVFSVRWLRDRKECGWLLGAMQALAVLSPILILAVRGIATAPTVCDTISVVHLGMLVCAATTLTILSRFEPLPVGLRFGGLLLVAGGAVAAQLYAAPQCPVGEWMPIWRENAATGLQMVVTPVLGLAAGLHLAAASRDWLRRFWTDFTIILVAAFAFAMVYTPAAAIACALAAPPIAWQVQEWLRRIRLIERVGPRVGAMAALSCVLLPAIPVILFATVNPA